jgi:hypothetical protein
MIGTCDLCKRREVDVTRHHLIPRTTHKNKKTKKETKFEDRIKTVPLCRPCHNQIHHIFTEKELERQWNTVEHLLTHPEVIKFVTWISKRAVGARLKVRA